MKYEAIVIGASAGGLKAMMAILGSLNELLPVPVFVAQHRSQQSNNYLEELLNQFGTTRVKEAEDKMPIEKGILYLAPPDYHLLIENKNYMALSLDEPVNYSRPSIDVLFESAAEVYKDKLIGIVLTGANSDGTAGLKEIKSAGGLTIVQDPKTAHVATMPESALTIDPDYVIPLDKMSEFLLTKIFPAKAKKHSAKKKT
ncbi:MAG: chemotaxis protein CheB [Lentisphaeraceae bacterium]|nr:chemotaxis protein CheB [Lentisphaeraceae bacterium]